MVVADCVQVMFGHALQRSAGLGFDWPTLIGRASAAGELDATISARILPMPRSVVVSHAAWARISVLRLRSRSVRRTGGRRRRGGRERLRRPTIRTRRVFAPRRHRMPPVRSCGCQRATGTELCRLQQVGDRVHGALHGISGAGRRIAAWRSVSSVESGRCGPVREHEFGHATRKW